MRSVWLALAGAALLGLAAVYDHAALYGRRVIALARGDARPLEQPLEPLERGLDHNDATAAEVLAVFDELAAQAYPRITVLEDDTEIRVGWRPARPGDTPGEMEPGDDPPPVQPVAGRHRGGVWWPAAPVAALVLVRCPVGA